MCRTVSNSKAQWLTRPTKVWVIWSAKYWNSLVSNVHGQLSGILAATFYVVRSKYSVLRAKQNRDFSQQMLDLVRQLSKLWKKPRATKKQAPSQRFLDAQDLVTSIHQSRESAERPEKEILYSHFNPIIATNGFVKQHVENFFVLQQKPSKILVLGSFIFSSFSSLFSLFFL